MEEIRLTPDQLEQLEQNYYNITEDCRSYKELFGKPHFRESDQKLQQSARKQFDFYKRALNATLETLMMHDYLSYSVTVSALKNRFVRFGTKMRILKHKTIGSHGK